MAEDAESSRKPRRVATWGRRAGAFGLGVALFVGAVSWDRCRDVVTSEGAVVEQCEPASASDGALLLGVLLIVLLLLPDVTEISVPGLVAIRRRVEEQERRQESLEHSVRQLSLQQTTLNLHIGGELQSPRVYDALAGLTAAKVEYRERELEMPTPPSTAPPADEREVDSEYSALVDKFLDVAASIEGANLRAIGSRELLEAERQGAPGPVLGTTMRRHSRLAEVQWADDMSESIQAVLAARNALLSGQRTDYETLRSALNLARSVHQALNDTYKKLGLPAS